MVTVVAEESKSKCKNAEAAGLTSRNSKQANSSTKELGNDVN